MGGLRGEYGGGQRADQDHAEKEPGGAVGDVRSGRRPRQPATGVTRPCGAAASGCPRAGSDLGFFGKSVLLAVLGFRTPQYVRYVFEDRIFSNVPPAKVSMPINLRRKASFSQRSGC